MPKPVLVLVLGAALVVVEAPARAADLPDDAASAPGPALLVTGIAVAVGGGAAQYFSARHYANDPGAGAGWLALSSLGGLTSEVGGALAATWGWRLGENHLAFDLAAGGPVKERRSLALGALAIGAAAFVAAYAAQIYLLTKTLSCETQNLTSGTTAVERCAKDQIIGATIFQLAANGVVLAVAPVAAYGFGYDAAARRSSEGHGFHYSLAPVLLPDGAGLRFSGRF